MRLEDTTEWMNSDDYRKRFTAEYWQTKIRQQKLENMIEDYECGQLEYEPKCSIELLMEQSRIMCEYLQVLEDRAEIEEIDIWPI